MRSLMLHLGKYPEIVIGSNKQWMWLMDKIPIAYGLLSGCLVFK